jgi:hypothetical protein
MLNCYCQLSSSVIFRQYGVSQSECKIDRPRPGLPRVSPRPHTEALGTRLIWACILWIIKGNIRLENVLLSQIFCKKIRNYKQQLANAIFFKSVVSTRHAWAWDTIISHGGSAVGYYSIPRWIAKSWIWVKYRKKSHYHVVQMLFFHSTIWIWGIIFSLIALSRSAINDFRDGWGEREIKTTKSNMAAKFR